MPVLGMMLIGIVWILATRKGSKSHNIRAPESIGGVLWLFCGSHVLGEFQGMGEMGDRERNEVITSWGKQYKLGTLVGIHGVEREGVEERLFVKEEEVEGGDELERCQSQEWH